MLANLGNSAASIGLEKVSFHSQYQRRAMPKNAESTTQSHSFHILER